MFVDTLKEFNFNIILNNKDMIPTQVKYKEKVIFSTNPDVIQFVYSDIKNFWEAFDLMEQGFEGNPFDDYYIKVGSKGVDGFMNTRIESADNLLAKVNKHKEMYRGMREYSNNIKANKKSVIASFNVLKKLYPEAQFPPIYFVVGAYTSGGTTSEDGIILGVEVLKKYNLDITGIIAHESIHFQQADNNSGDNSLLYAAIREGSADFIGEMISGNNINAETYKYGYENEEKLYKEFVKVMYGEEFNDWLYGTSGKDNRPNDLGYWMGYQITKEYYDEQKDKKKAIKEILNFSDAKAFLDGSGYLEKYIKQE